MSKYYTPSVEEFRIGFEYERLIIDSWKSFTMTDIPLFIDLNAKTLKELLQQEWIRVKYLDQSDIEELGFVFKLESDKDYMSEYSKIIDEYSSNIIRLYNHCHWYNLEIYRLFSYDITNYTNIFKGIIKNKSELKVVLKQLGIE